MILTTLMLIIIIKYDKIICIFTKKTMKRKTVILPQTVIDKLEKERKKLKPAPSLHAYMVYKLGK